MHTSRREFAAAGAAALFGRAPALAAGRRPNVLFLMPDQLRAQALGVTGNPDVRTPTLDRFAKEGLLLRHTFANTPVCCPARANLLTGKYTHKNGMVANDLRLRESEQTLSAILRGAGYRTGFVGKWHLDGGPRMPGYVPPGPRRHGFEWWAANECSHRHFDTQYFRDSETPIPMTKFETEGWTDLALEFLEGSKRGDRPFFLTVQMGPPHDPYKAPPAYRAMYDPAKLTMRKNWQEKPGLPTRADIAEYYGMITSADEQIGRMLRALDEHGMREDTIVLVSSDHGDMLGSQGRRLKRKPWEESIRVPGILRYPRKVKAGTSDLIFTHVDFAPTLLGFCGMKDGGMQGKDLSGAIGGGGQGPESAFFQIFGPFQGDGTEDGWRGVRTSRYTYARFEHKPWVLYDLDQDPDQLHNLVDDRGAAGLIREMEKRLSGWMKQTGDSWTYNWHELVEDNGRLYKHGTFYTVDEYLKWAKAHPEQAR